MFPLATVLFPGGVLPLHVFEPRYRAMIADCLKGDRTFGVVLIARGSEVGGGDQRYGVGTEARVERAASLPDGRWAVIATGTERIEVDEWLPEDPYPKARVRRLPDATPSSQAATERATAAVRRVLGLLSELGQAVGDAPLGTDVDRLDAPALAWRLCDAAPLGAIDRQRLLERAGAPSRLEALIGLMAEMGDDLRRMLAEGGSP
ncbi:MAG: LON peptidase substrate-binding domain-containing protein [Acidimicrobiales bacterium]